MAENQNPSGENQSQERNMSFNPLSDNVNERSYTRPSIDVSPDQLNQRIPEPVYSPQPISTRQDPYSMLGGDGPARPGGGGKADAPPINPAMNNVSDADMKLGAEHLSKLIIDGYEQMHTFANKTLQFPERKIRKLQSEGEIDLAIEIPYDYGETITAGEFIKAYNEQNKDALTVSREFKKEVTPVLTRVLQKRGAGITDEQYLMYLFGKDIAVKGVIMFQIRSTMRDMIDVIKDYTVAYRETGQAPMPKQSEQRREAESPKDEPPPSPPEGSQGMPEGPSQPKFPTPVGRQRVPQGGEIIDMNDPRFNFNQNETVMASAVQQMDVPSTGKKRLMAQRAREREWSKKLQNSGDRPMNAYEQAKAGRAKVGKGRGRKKKGDIPMDEDQIAEAIVLNESKPENPNIIPGID